MSPKKRRVKKSDHVIITLGDQPALHVRYDDDNDTSVWLDTTREDRFSGTIIGSARGRNIAAATADAVKTLEQLIVFLNEIKP